MTEFTKKDREFIIKIAKSIEDYKKETDARLSKLEGKDEKVLSPVQPASKRKRNKGRDKFRVDVPFGGVPDEGESSIQITFKDGEADAMKHKVLAELLYMTLQQLCEDNGIEQLLIRIEQ
jgi:hypothetical protein